MTHEEAVSHWKKKKDEAFKSLGRMTGDKGTPFEVQYALAYKKLVLLGVAAPLRGKYGVPR